MVQIKYSYQRDTLDNWVIIKTYDLQEADIITDYQQIKDLCTENMPENWIFETPKEPEFLLGSGDTNHEEKLTAANLEKLKTDSNSYVAVHLVKVMNVLYLGKRSEGSQREILDQVLILIRQPKLSVIGVENFCKRYMPANYENTNENHVLLLNTTNRHETMLGTTQVNVIKEWICECTTTPYYKFAVSIQPTTAPEIKKNLVSILIQMSQRCDAAAGL